MINSCAGWEYVASITSIVEKDYCFLHGLNMGNVGCLYKKVEQND